MRAIARTPASSLSLEDWGNLDEDVEGELVDGVLEEEEMATALHEIVVSWFIAALRLWVGSRRAQVFGSELKIAVGARRGRKPDVSVFTTERPKLTDTVVRARPFLVVEVLSPRPRDARRDRVDKLRDYAAAGARHYWIVDPQLRTLEMLRLERGAYVHVTPVSADRVRAVGFPGLLLDLSKLWAEVDRAGHEPRRRSRR
jgi:Uma2 family endonuclease